jgi:CHAD domain-containing protein
LRTRRVGELKRLVRRLGSRAHIESVERIRHAIVNATNRVTEQAIENLARATLLRELRRLERRLHGDLTRPDGYHAVRRQGRRVRDLIDVFSASLGKSSRAWRARLQPIQSQLGRLNDLDVALTLLATTKKTAMVGTVMDTLRLKRYETLAETATPLALLAVRLRR